MYRLRDGVVDCPYEDDEDNKLNCSIFAMKNRFRCSETEQTCLLASTLGNLKPDCRISEHDEHFSLLNVKLSDFRCKIPNSVECETVREYISYSQNISSPLILTAFMKNNQLSVPHNHGQISFHRYCDSFWDLDYGFDETPSLCKDWICHPDQYQCVTGQCIPVEWVCNRVWDCSDASDEQALYLIKTVSPHNAGLPVSLRIMKEKCARLYLGKEPFLENCNSSTEYGCLLADVDHVIVTSQETITFNQTVISLETLTFNKTVTVIWVAKPRPCIRLEQ
ncbi:unnamed protein product, partial [Didymodactylos carnosus]